jgi:hypothetical protein
VVDIAIESDDDGRFPGWFFWRGFSDYLGRLFGGGGWLLRGSGGFHHWSFFGDNGFGWGAGSRGCRRCTGCQQTGEAEYYQDDQAELELSSVVTRFHFFPPYKLGRYG